MQAPPAPPEGTVVAERRNHLLYIGLNRPAKLNGLTPAMLRELSDAYSTLEDDPDLRVGLLHAYGPNFTSGLDLPAMAELMRQGRRAYRLGQVDPYDLGLPGFRRRSKPLVCAVHGITFTAGIELMLAADIAVAADTTRFSQLEVKRGIIATGGATLRMAQRAGLGNAMLHLLTGDEFCSAEALRLNFVQKVVPAGQEFQEAERIAEEIARQAPLAVSAMRSNTMKAIERGPQAAVDDLLATQQRLAKTEDAKEGIRSFVERRPARFTGE